MELAGDRVDAEDEKEEIETLYYLKLPKTCRCRKFISNYEADQFVALGKAMRTFKLLARGLVRDENRIWMDVVRSKVPRVDLISRSDVERAYTGSNKRSQFRRYSPISQRYELIVPRNKTIGSQLLLEAQETKKEKRIQKQYKEYIEGVHDLYMNFRAKLIVPFKPHPDDLFKDDDHLPYPGRTLFSFGPDMKTKGGYKEST